MPSLKSNTDLSRYKFYYYWRSRIKNDQRTGGKFGEVA